MITGKYATLVQVCNNSALQRKDLESRHTRDVSIYQLAPTTSGPGDDSHTKETSMIQMSSSY